MPAGTDFLSRERRHCAATDKDTTMKKLLIYPALILSLGACNSRAEKEAEMESANQAAIEAIEDMQERARLEDSMAVVTDATVVAAPTLIPEEPRTSPARNSRIPTHDKKET